MGDIGVRGRRENTRNIKTEIKYRNAWYLDWIQRDQDRAWSCEHGNEHSGFIVHQGFLPRLLSPSQGLSSMYQLFFVDSCDLLSYERLLEKPGEAFGWLLILINLEICLKLISL
jgi:hypothetical protein